MNSLDEVKGNSIQGELMETKRYTEALPSALIEEQEEEITPPLQILLEPKVEIVCDEEEEEEAMDFDEKMAEPVPGSSRDVPRIPSPKTGIHTMKKGERKIIAKVAECCDMEKSRKELLAPLNQSQKRASIYTGASVSTIQRIKKFKDTHPNQSLETPGKKRVRSSGKAVISESDRCVIRDTINDFYIIQKVVPTISKLLPALQDKINWQWGPTTLRTILKDMGFVWKKVQNKRTLLLERADIVDWRYHFLVKMKHFREDGRNIYYIDETWIDSNLTMGKCWQKEKDIIGVTGSTSKRLIIASVGSSNGFMSQGQLIFEAKSVQGDYHGQMNADNFEKWFKTQVLPNLPPSSVIVMDNAPYHSRQVERTPLRYDTKAAMIGWLQKREISCNIEQRKTMLYSLVEANRPTEKIYVVDVMAAESGHRVVRLPPYNCDLNAIELAWTQIKRYFKEHNISGDITATHLHELTLSGFQFVTPSDWQMFCNHIVNLERDYWEKDGIMEMAVEDIIVNATENTSEDSDLSEADDI